MRNYRTFRETLLESLQDMEYAKTYLLVSLEDYKKDKDVHTFLEALRDVAEARGGITKLSEKTELSRQNLYRALSSKGNPRLDTIETILDGLGFKLSIETKKPLKKCA